MAFAISTTDPELRDASERRLRELRLKRNRMGHSTPPETVIEIEEIEAELRRGEQEPATEAERYAALAQRVGDLALLLHETRIDVRRLLWSLPVLVIIFYILVKL